MVEVTYYCPHCGAVTGLEREGYLADKSVTAEPLEGWEYAVTTDAFDGESGDSETGFDGADGVEMVCLGDATPGADEPDGCGRTYYLNFVKYEGGREVQPEGGWLEDEPNFDFLR